jgi:beta-xylosidase
MVPRIGAGQFSFSYTVNPGLSYRILVSSDLINWQPVTTNKAASNPAVYATPLPLGNSSFYEVQRMDQ